MTWATISQVNAPCGAVPKVTCAEIDREKYLSAIACIRSDTWVRSASPVST
jgi:hypothetical protein